MNLATSGPTAAGSPDRQTSVGIVGGCGHIGLPLGIALAREGAQVVLIDSDPARVEEVAAGRAPFLEDGADDLLPGLLAAGRLQATADVEAVREPDAIVVTIGTPVDEFLEPSISSFDRALGEVLRRIKDGGLLILRSTVFPGVTDRLARRVAEHGPKIDVAYCPERIAQGHAMDELRRLPQIVGGVTPRAAQRAAALFATLGADIVELAPVEAELAKLFANAYRYINFAVSNQFYVIAQGLGADFQRIHAAVTKDYPRMKGFAKAGLAAGPCLLKDTLQLGAFNHGAFPLGQAAMTVNEGLPSALVKMAKARFDLSNKTAAILGMAFKGNCDDARDSLAYKLRKVLTLECRRVLCTDVYLDDPGFVSLETALREADILFLGACHDEYRDLAIAKPVVDAFGFLGNARHAIHGGGCSRVPRWRPRRAA